MAYYSSSTTSPDSVKMFIIVFALLAILPAASFFVGANTFSLHSMYGNRLVRSYLGSTNPDRKPDPFTGFDPGDNCTMESLRAAMESRPRSERRLFPVINIALNMAAPSHEHLDWQHRKACGYTVSPLHAGSSCTGFQPAATYTGEDGITLARAMTISGAAATPNMGYHTSTLVAFAMTFFNIRLGWWLPNPGVAGEKYWDRREPKGGIMSLLKESLASTSNANPYVYLSDGGHFENLGLFEMVQRRCHRIVVIDAGCDPHYQFEDLENAVRKIRIDLGIAIVFPEGLPTPAWAKGDLNRHRHSTVGTIRYSDTDGAGNDGVIIYIKPLLSGDEPLDIARYAALTKKNQRNPFPHHPTSDQFFDEVRFESYRELGYHSVIRDPILGKNARAGAPWPAPIPNAVDASEAAVAAAEINTLIPVEPGGGANAAQFLGAAGLMSLIAIAIPTLVALGLAAIVALERLDKSQRTATGTPLVTETTATSAREADQRALAERLVQLLTATSQLETSVSAVNAESARTVAEMHKLLLAEIELMKLARPQDQAPPNKVILEVLVQIRDALKKDPLVAADPNSGRLLDKLEETRTLIEAQHIGAGLRNIDTSLKKVEAGINRINPRSNVRASDGGR